MVLPSTTQTAPAAPEPTRTVHCTEGTEIACERQSTSGQGSSTQKVTCWLTQTQTRFPPHDEVLSLQPPMICDCSGPAGEAPAAGTTSPMALAARARARMAVTLTFMRS